MDQFTAAELAGALPVEFAVGPVAGNTLLAHALSEAKTGSVNFATGGLAVSAAGNNVAMVGPLKSLDSQLQRSVSLHGHGKLFLSPRTVK